MGNKVGNKNPLDFYKNKNVLVLGGRGYIGSKLKMVLLRLGASVCVPNSRLFDCDWPNLLEGIDVVFHLVAETNLAVTEAQPASILQTEFMPTIDMLEAMIQFKNSRIPPRIIFAGTATQFGITNETMRVNENYPSISLTFYDAMKTMIEQALVAYSIQWQLPTATLRLSNVYGPSLNESGQNRGVVNKWVKYAVNNIGFLVNQHLYNKLRDFVYIDDVVEAFLLAGRGPEHFLDGSHYIVASGESWNFQQLIGHIEMELMRSVDYTVVDEPLNNLIDNRSVVLNPVLMKKCFGWQAKTDVTKGIRELIKLYS